MGELDNQVGAARDADADDRSGGGRLDDRSEVLHVLESRVRAHERVRSSSTPTVDGDDTEFLAKLLENRLKGRQSVYDRIDEYDRRLAAAMLVEDESRAVALRVPGAVNAVARTVAVGVGLAERHGALVVGVRSIQVVIVAGQVAQHQEALALDAPGGRCRIALARGREPHAHLKLGYRLCDSMPRLCQPTGGQQINCRPVGQAGIDEMMRDDFGLCHRDLWPQALDRLRDARMQLLTGRFEQGGVGRVADERVLEAVRMMRRRPTSLDESRQAQLAERRGQLRLGASGYRPDDVLIELPTDAGGDLRYLACRSQTVETRHERILKCRRNSQRRKWASKLEIAMASRCLPDRRFEDRFRQFLDEQRYALRAAENGFDDDWRQRPFTCRHLDELPGCWPPEAIEAKQRDVREIRPRRLLVRPQGDDEKDRQNPDPVHHSFEQLRRRRIEPMRVLQDHEHRQLARKPL